MPLTIVMTAACIINAVYYENYVSFASFSLLSTASFLGDMNGDIVTGLIHLKDVILIFPVIALPIIHFILKKKKYYSKVEKLERPKKRFLNTVILGAVMTFFTITMMSGSDYSRLKKQWNREYLVQRFGIYVYQLNDAIKSTQSKFTSLFGYDSASKTVREFYDEKEKTDTVNDKTNEYKNIFEGKNLIVIHAESIQQFTMETSFNDKEVTPNLNRLASEGMYFTNFYAQESVGTSSDTEFTFNTSLMPSSNGTVFVNYWDREYLTIPKLMNEKNYYTFSMHGNNCTMWNRNVVHEAFGYNKFYCYNKDFNIDEVLGLGLSDKSFFKQAVPKIKDISNKYNNFYGVLIMLTNHTPFAAASTIDYDVDFKYEKLNEETGEMETVSAPYMEGTTLGDYFKTVHYADEAIGQFINDLDEAGLLENTVIVIYGDHDAKIKKAEYKRFYNYDPYTDTVISSKDENYQNVDSYSYELNRKVPLIIWTKDKELQKKINVKIDKVMGMYDVMPTLGNMFNFSSKYSLGHDIFNIDDNTVVFPDGDWLTNKLYYNSQKGEWKLLNPEETVSMDYIDDRNAYAEEIINISDSIITYDLIKKTRESKELIESAN